MLKHIRSSERFANKSLAEQGFTLVELLVVIAILGILAVVGILSFQGLTDSAKESTAKTEKSQVQVAVDAMTAADDGVAPADDTDLTAAELTPYLKAGTTLQCAYTLTGGEVAFAATQTDANCAD